MALARGARRVAKFEDLAAGTARTLQARLEGMGLRVRVSGPYQKRFDVSVAAPGAVAELFTVVASWGQEADQVIDAEQDRTAQGTRRAGLALGYPPCCVEHFTSLERGPAAQAGGINEAAIRSPRGVRAPRIPWEMNPLCIHSPIGFTPCSVDCAGALAFARRVLEAVRQEHPASYETVQRALRRPILFFRFPLFHVLEAAPGPWSGEGARYRGAVAAVEPRVAPELAAWHEDEVGRALAEGDRVSLERGALQILRGDVRVARWTLEDPEIPLLLRFETGG